MRANGFTTPIMIAATALVLSLPLAAQQPPPDIPPPGTPGTDQEPPLPPKLTPDEDFEPSVIIREEEDRTIQEYRRNGQLYMVKVTPKGGLPPYYYMDEDGDGQLELQPGDDIGPVRPAFWKIKEW